MFRHVELAEEAGSGLPKVLRVWREEGLQLPSLHSDTERYEFQLKLRLVHLLSERDRSWLAWCARTQLSQDQPGLPGLEPLSQHEQMVLVQAREVGSINNAAAQALTGLHRADVTKLLVGLRDRGLLQQEGTKRWASYRLPDPVRSVYEQKVIKKSDKEAKGVIKKSDELINIILDLCKSPKSAKELGQELNMNRSYLVNKYLGPMVRGGLLAYTKPESPRARNQKYMAPKGR
jgi:ATP-dependent DNA helicase RecG